MKIKSKTINSFQEQLKSTVEQQKNSLPLYSVEIEGEIMEEKHLNMFFPWL